MEHSLNHEIDSEDDAREDKLADLVFKESPNGQTPELDENISIIAALDSAHNKIDDVRETIVISGVIDKKTALEAHYVTGSLLTESNPITKYTTIPTRTGLSAALENLDNEKKNIISRLFEKIKEYIKKVIAWLGGLFNKPPNKMDQNKVEEFFDRYFQKNVKVAKGCAVVQSRKEDFFNRLTDILQRKGIEQAILDNVRTFGQKTLEYFERNDQRFQAYRDALAGSPLVCAMMFNTDYFKNLVKLNTYIHNFSNGLKEISDSLQSGGHEEVFQMTLADASKFSDEIKKELGDTKQSIAEIEKMFKGLYEGVTSRFSDKLKDYTIEEFLEDTRYVNSEISDNAFKKMSESSANIQELQKQYSNILDSLTKVMAVFEEARNNKKANQEVIGVFHQSFRDMFQTLSAGSSLVTRYYDEVTRCQTSADKITRACISFVEGANEYVRSMVEGVPEEAREEVKKYMTGVGFILE